MRSITRAGRRSIALAAGLLLVAISAAPALACGGLIGPNGAVNLLRTTTFAGYHDGVEHYVTAFEFAGGGGAFGSLTPLPGVPTSVEKGGDWTLQRLDPRDGPACPRPRCFGARGGSGGERRGPDGGHDRRPRPHRAQGRRRRRSARGPRTTASASRPTRPRCSTSTRSAARSSWPRRSTPTRPRHAGRTSVTARPSTSRSRPTTRGSRCGSWRLGKTGNEHVEADVYLMTDQLARRCCPQPDGFERHDAPAFERRHATSLLADLRSDRGHGVGARLGVADQDRDRCRRAAARL